MHRLLKRGRIPKPGSVGASPLISVLGDALFDIAFSVRGPELHRSVMYDTTRDHQHLAVLYRR